MKPRMKPALAVVCALLSMGQAVRRPFKSDPPKMCQACPGWNKDRDPIRIYGDTYYVGTAGLSSVLITSGRGHILIDGGLAQSAELIDRHIRKLGFKTEDVKLIVNSHSHYDHAGGIHALQAASGARVALSRPAAEALRRGENTVDDPQYGFGHDSNAFPPVTFAHVIHDGDVLNVGALAITAHMTPGHTPGGTTWTWKSCEGVRCLDIVYADSLNAISAPGFKYTNDPARVAAFRKSIATVASLPCDIVLAPHPNLIRFEAKAAAKSFVDPQGCREYAAQAKKTLDERLASEQKP